MRPKRTCSNCICGISIPVNNDIFCREKGIVSYDYSCSKHRFIPEIKAFRAMNFKCIDCENFLFDTTETGPNSKGICMLFSTRKFDGEEKNACSKFVKKANHARRSFLA